MEQAVRARRNRHKHTLTERRCERLTYEFVVAPHLIVQPDIQYIIRPGGAGTIPDALVLGMQIAVNF